jgi:hypothetical protein
VLFGGLAPEQRPIAERLAAGGIPAVRRAIAEERERARSEGRPEVSGEAILALAEQLAPSVKQAIWLDRAEAAVAQLEQLSLRDLRTTVAAAAPRDETARDLDRKLREELERRVKKLRTHWEEQMTHALEEGRVLQALRFSAQPPEPTARFPAALVERLAASAGAAMTSSTPVERWLAILEASLASPIRRQIHPEGLPEDASGEVMRKARLAAGSIPALAPMIGLSMPPPPKPIKSVRPARPPRPPARPPKRPARTDAPSGASPTGAHRAGGVDDQAPDDAVAEGEPAPLSGAGIELAESVLEETEAVETEAVEPMAEAPTVDVETVPDDDAGASDVVPAVEELADAGAGDASADGAGREPDADASAPAAENASDDAAEPVESRVQGEVPEQPADAVEAEAVAVDETGPAGSGQAETGSVEPGGEAELPTSPGPGVEVRDHAPEPQGDDEAIGQAPASAESSVP